MKLASRVLSPYAALIESRFRAPCIAPGPSRRQLSPFPEVLVLDDEEIRIKREAVACYASQLDFQFGGAHAARKAIGSAGTGSWALRMGRRRAERCASIIRDWGDGDPRLRRSKGQRMVDGKWTVRNSSYALRTPWFSVRSDDCVTPAGAAIAPYHVLEFPDFVHVFATSEDRVVLVRQYRHGCGELSLELPGGIVDRGETDVVAAGARELKEETGYNGGRWRVLTALSVDPARYANRLYLVRANDVIAGTAAPEPTEDIEIVLVSREEALQLAMSGGIRNAAHAGMLMIGLGSPA